MKCDEYRQAVAANPSYDGGGEHLSQCPACQTFCGEMQALDRQIERALAISVPELEMPELPDIDTDKVAVLPGRRFGTRSWLAVAASVTVAVAIGFLTLVGQTNRLSLADEILAHIDHEPYALRVTDSAVSDERLARIVPANIATMDHSAGLITYAQSCTINGREIPHLVIQGVNGPITILLMPEEMVSGAETISGESVNGVILPVGKGSIAIIGEVGEDLKNVRQKVRDSVAWSTSST